MYIITGNSKTYKQNIKIYIIAIQDSNLLHIDTTCKIEYATLFDNYFDAVSTVQAIRKRKIANVFPIVIVSKLNIEKLTEK